ncbi:MAG: diaminopimelate decarboxylase [Ruminococcaceae bacterium]|nr:diaminopimelate decarboxylase [Oscillospiraceae bacterium]
MFISECLSVNEQNHLTIGGLDTVSLAEEYGTPLYVFDENQIRKNCRLYTESMKTFYGGNGLILYASKAFCTMAMCKIIDSEGMGLDVVSGGELFTAHKAGFPMEKIYFHGNNKSKAELELALSFGVGRIVVDNFDELHLLNELCDKAEKKAAVLFRIKPGIDAHTHDFIMTGQIDSKFGVALETGEAMELLREASSLSNIEVVGLHCHIGSQIFDLPPFCEAAQVMLNFIADIKDELGLTIQELNLGGGFGIQYTENDDPISYDKYMEAVSKTVKETAAKRNIKLPRILMEPGRSIVGSAGITLYNVGFVKEIPGIRNYLSVDGGMADNPRYMLYDAEYTFLLANRANEEKTSTYTVAGKSCESGDLLGEGISLPKAHTGDTLAVLATGAYNYSMASNYNRLPRPAAIMVKDGKSRVIIKRETYEDIIKNDTCE